MPFGGVWLHHFTVTGVPVDTVVGSPIKITVTAIDQNGAVYSVYNGGANVSVQGAVTPTALSYTGVTGGLTDNHDGTGAITAGTFSGGQFIFNVTYTVAYDSVTIRVVSDSSGTSPAIMWYAGALSRVQVRLNSGKDTLVAVAGANFPEAVAVLTYDSYGNVAEFYGHGGFRRRVTGRVRRTSGCRGRTRSWRRTRGCIIFWPGRSAW